MYSTLDIYGTTPKYIRAHYQEAGTALRKVMSSIPDKCV